MREPISHRVVPGLIGALKGSRNLGIGGGEIARQGFIALLPAITLVLFLGFMCMWRPSPWSNEAAGLMEMGGGGAEEAAGEGGVEEPKAEGWPNRRRRGRGGQGATGRGRRRPQGTAG
jgi:hypothetical protein